MADDKANATTSAAPDAAASGSGSKPKAPKAVASGSGSSSRATVPAPRATTAFAASKDAKVVIPQPKKKGYDFGTLDFKAILAGIAALLNNGLTAEDGTDGMMAIYDLLAYVGPDPLYLRQLMLAFLAAASQKDSENPNRPQAYTCFVFVLSCVYVRGIKFQAAMKKMSEEGKAILTQCMAFFSPIMLFPEDKFGQADYQMLTPSRLVICFPDIMSVIAAAFNSKVNRFGNFLPETLRFPGSIALVDAPTPAFINAYHQMMWHYDQLINAKKQRNTKAVREAMINVKSYCDTSRNSSVRGQLALIKCPTAGVSGDELKLPELKKKKEAEEDE